jgi:hypothetical protein
VLHKAAGFARPAGYAFIKELFKLFFYLAGETAVCFHLSGLCKAYFVCNTDSITATMIYAPRRFLSI